jgi:type III secretion protein L
MADGAAPGPGDRPIFAPAGRIVRAKDIAAWHEGDGYIAAATAEARGIITRAEAERDQLIEAGRREGERAGAAAITARTADVTQHLDRFLARSEDWLAELIVDTVERILGRLNSRKATLSAAATALRAFRHARRLSVRVPPADVAWVEEGLKEALEPALQALLVIQPDPQLGPGRCIVASEFGLVEAGIAEQVAALRNGLRAELEESRAEQETPGHG